MKKLVLTALLGGSAVLIGLASADVARGGEQPLFKPRECTRVPGGLYCERQLVETSDRTFTFTVDDATCPVTGRRVVERTETVRYTSLTWSIFSPPAPLRRFEIAGNETSPTEEILASSERDLGCEQPG